MANPSPKSSQAGGVNDTHVVNDADPAQATQSDAVLAPLAIERAAGNAEIVPTAAAAKPEGAFELSIIVPTFNERENIRPLIEILSANLTDVAWEAIFVDDDSPDGTAEHVRSLTAEFSNIP